MERIIKKVKILRRRKPKRKIWQKKRFLVPAALVCAALTINSILEEQKARKRVRGAESRLVVEKEKSRKLALELNECEKRGGMEREANGETGGKKEFAFRTQK